MTPKDLARLQEAAYADGEAGRAWSADAFAEALSDRHTFLCLAGEPPQAFALGRAVAGEAELLALAVAPGARRSGLGRAALDGFEREALKRGAGVVFLEVSVANGAARALYSAGGYRERGRRRGYYRDGAGRPADALILSRPLGGTAQGDPSEGNLTESR